MAHLALVNVLLLCSIQFWSIDANLVSNPEGRAVLVLEQAHVPRETGLFAGSRDAYCRVYVNDVFIGKTRVIDDTHTPAWNHRFNIGLIRKDTKIRFSLWDKDYLDADDFMGTTTVTAQEILDKNANDTSYVRHFPHGFVQFKLTWIPCDGNVCR